MSAIPSSFLDLLEQKKAFANLATLMPDGSPQVTPVWFDYKDGLIRVNSAKGRIKSRNMTSRWPSWTRTIPIAISRSVVGSGVSPKRVRARTLTRPPGNISARKIPLCATRRNPRDVRDRADVSS
jgi:hypothetical protein